MAAPRRPNILWVSFEDTNPFYGCYGDPVARTPNVDRLAAEGCRWPRAFSTAGVCAPARSAVITGMYPTAIGTHHMRTTHVNPHTPEMPTPYDAVVPHYVKCFSEYLRAAGYYCTNNVKTDYQFAAPRTAWDECSTTAHWRDRGDADQPFFAVFNPTVTHESGMWAEKCPEPTFDPADMIVPPIFPDTAEVRLALARMYTNIETADRFLGERLAELEADGLADNTIVMHWSDHGPLPRGKRWPYDSGIRIPMIIRWPGRLDGGTVSDRLVSTIDLGPTVLSAAGLPIPAHMQGRAFLGEREAAPREYIYAARDRHDTAYDMVRAVRDRRFKYMRNYRPDISGAPWIVYLNRHPIMQALWRLHRAGELNEAQSLLFNRPRPIEELYDTDADPWETRNLAGDPHYAAHLDRLRGALDGWRRDVGDLGEIPESEMVRRWYPDGRQPQTAAPLAIALDDTDHRGFEPIDGEAVLAAGALLQLHSATQGASIAWRTDDGDDPPGWHLYTEPLRLRRGTTTVRARAIRIGYAESDEMRVTVRV